MIIQVIKTYKIQVIKTYIFYPRKLLKIRKIITRM